MINRSPVGLRICVIGSLDRKFPYPVNDLGDFFHASISNLKPGNTILDILLSPFKSPHLPSHFLWYGKPCGIIPCPVNAVAGWELFCGFGFVFVRNIKLPFRELWQHIVCDYLHNLSSVTFLYKSHIHPVSLSRYRCFLIKPLAINDKISNK